MERYTTYKQSQFLKKLGYDGLSDCIWETDKYIIPIPLDKSKPRRLIKNSELSEISCTPVFLIQAIHWLMDNSSMKAKIEHHLSKDRKVTKSIKLLYSDTEILKASIGMSEMFFPDTLVVINIIIDFLTIEEKFGRIK